MKSKQISTGMVYIFSAMEGCTTYKPWHDKTSGKTFLKHDSGKCLHYYFYLIDEELGLCYLRVPTWPPFRLQFYMNGRNWLAYVQISDWDLAQKLSERINPEDLHRIPDAFAKKYCPIIDVCTVTLFSRDCKYFSRYA